jgi:hypothetical protein
MLNRKAIPIMSVLILVMLAGDIWQVTHGERWSMVLFTPPFIVINMVISFIARDRDVLASVDALAAWREWGNTLGIFCALTLTMCQLLPVFLGLGLPLPSSELTSLIGRSLLAGCGIVIVVFGNRMPKLPPLESRPPSVWSLGTVEQLAISRLTGWLLVSLGLTMIVSVLLLSWKMIGLLIGSVGIATLVLILVNRFELIVTKFRRAAE